MRATNFVGRLREFFIGADDHADAAGDDLADLRHEAANDQAHDLCRMVARIKERGDGTVMAGCVRLLGLHTVKERLGSKWTSVESKALQIAEEVLAEHLGPADVYRIVDTATFQICFESDNEAVAQAVVSQIATRIEARIAAELAEAAGQLSADSFAAPVPCARIRDACDPLSALYSNLLQIRDAVNARALRRHSIPALRYAGALFQPLWSNRDFGRTKNRCLLDTLAGAAAAKHLEEIEELDDLIEALANLDCVIFAKSIEGLHHALGDIKRATIVVPVHFQTLAAEQQEFLDIARTLPLPYRRFVLLDVIGLPTAATGSEVLRALKVGRTVTDRLILQVSPTDHRMSESVMSLLWGVSMNLGELDSEDPLIVQELRRFAHAASEHGLHSFAYGANTMGKALSVVEAGFDYVGGTAVANTAPVPRPHARFTPLFGDHVPKTGGLDGKAGLREHPRFAPLEPNSTITLPDGEQHDCRIRNVSASGAVVMSKLVVKAGDYLVIGSIPAQVVRFTKRGFAVRFLEVQQHSAIEIALHTPISSDKLLENLRMLQG